jgi:hypothetical protein
VVAAVAEVCHEHFTNPGFVRAEWVPGALRTATFQRHDFAQTQAQLSAIGEAAVLAHPFAALAQVANTVRWELFEHPLSDLAGDSDGSGWFNRFLVARRWFSVTQRAPGVGEGLKSLNAATLALPRVLLWFATLAGLVRGWRRRRLWPRGRWSTSTSAGWLAGVTVGASVVATAIGGPPEWSYWLPLVPLLAVLVGLALRPLPEN